MKTMVEMDAMITELEDLEIRYTALKKESSAANDLVETKRMEILKELELQGMTSFKGTIGAVSVTHRHNVKFPSDPGPRLALRKYLDEKNAFESLWSINHQRLNAWYKEEIASLQDEGEMPDVPGLSPVIDTNLSFRRAAK